MVVSCLMGHAGIVGGKQKADCFEDDFVLEKAVCSEVVVGGVLVGVIVDKFVAKAVHGEPAVDPGHDLVVQDPLLRHLVLEVGLVSDVNGGVRSV